MNSIVDGQTLELVDKIFEGMRAHFWMFGIFGKADEDETTETTCDVKGPPKVDEGGKARCDGRKKDELGI